MSQFDFGTMVASTKSGTAFIGDINAWRTALNSCHSGSARPTYAVAKTIWVNDAVNPWTVYMYDGVDDIILGTVNTTTNTFTTANVPAGSIAATTTQGAINELDANKTPITYTQFGGTIYVNTTMLVADSGKFFNLASGIATLPPPTNGLRYKFIGEGIGNPSGTVAAGSGVGVGYPDGTAVSAGTISVGKYTTVDVMASNGSWYITNTSGQILTKAATLPSHAVNYGQVLGLGQTWQNLIASRALATTYTNTTGKPISVFVSVSNTGASAGTCRADVGSVGVARINFPAVNDGINKVMPVYFIVPPGNTYSVTATFATLYEWSELR